MSEAVLLYDADCGFCGRAVDAVLAWDRAGALRPVALQSPEADRLLPGLSEQTRMASWHLVIDGSVHSGGAVAAPLLRLLPGGRPLAELAAAFPALTERAYRLVARNRDRFGRLAGARCTVDPGRSREEALANPVGRERAER
jgi:predicted DCC family thiol-disulfide oxidoreductase YuxK